jgi:hypothetical protein
MRAFFEGASAMHKRFRRLALFVGGASLAGGGLILAACGTDNGSTVATPQVEAGNRETGGNPDTGTGSDAGVVDGSTVDCGNVPTLRTNTAAGGFYCAFYKADAAVDGAAGLGNCVTGQTCCNPGIADGGAFANKFPPAFCANGRGGDTECVAQAAAHASEYQPGFFSQAWQCDDSTACPAGEICVMFTSPYVSKPGDVVNVGIDTKSPAACGVYKAYKQGGSICKAGTAAANEVKLCSANDPTCGAGTTCLPFNGNGRDLGSCR